MGRQRTTKIDEAQASSAPAAAPMFATPKWKPAPRPRREGAPESSAAGAWVWLGSHPNPFHQSVAIGPMTFPSFTGFGAGGDSESADTDLSEGVTMGVATQPSDGGLLLPGAVVELSCEQLQRLELELDHEVIDLAYPAGARAISIKLLRMQRAIERMIGAKDAERPFEPSDEFERQLGYELERFSREGLVRHITGGGFLTQLQALGEYRPNTMIPAGAFCYLVPLAHGALELPESERPTWRPSPRLRGWKRFSDDRLPPPLRRMTKPQAVEFTKYLAKESKRFMAARADVKVGAATVNWTSESWRQQNPFETPGGYSRYLKLWPPLDEPESQPEPATAPQGQEGREA